MSLSSDIRTRPSASVLETSGKSSLLGVSFANISLEEALQQLESAMNGNRSVNLFFVNSHCLNVSYRNINYRQALEQADLVFPDGSGVAMGCQRKGEQLQHNLNGTDLFPQLCALAARMGRSVFFLGAKPGIAAQVADWARAEYPGLKVAGTQDGYFSEEEEPEVIAGINRSNADILLVGMGVPVQELWLNRVQPQLKTSLNLAVGGLFDYYSGRIPRAPLWMRQRGLEWVWRLRQEPGRMWRRYLLGNPLYTLRLRYELGTQRLVRALPESITTRSKRMYLSLRASYQRLRHHLRPIGLDGAKRTTDIILATGALIVASPLLLIVAIAIKLDSPGPVFFGQVRAGCRARPFRMWKFRSMVVNAEALRAELEQQNEVSDGVTFKIKEDPRITRVGRFIRKYSIDELPQLANVLIGQMSIVGPRPALYSELTKYELEQRYRLDLKPGLTSEWVVAGRNNLSFQEQAALDVAYRKNRSFWGDFKIMVKTVPALLAGRGAS
ncbi:WecB/TagA/CpsF family glycosyltransferase [Marinobacter salinisoli]|uniref:WecB/TagA/CpsF family glycosyltransferase n=1 Tax=Marinobacter salinisoli TaxID=2769486 RepID=A0ABX7MRD1_9GAMM|nr:WecB/TagA/CpsF family glycosyltransferase [Marinobacter salinisoli]QSP93980.1 WecB/TagA/CpsF family glycosyltransferase [Marinobacter salinisoli]